CASFEPHFAIFSPRSDAMWLKNGFLKTKICSFSTSKVNPQHALGKPPPPARCEDESPAITGLTK
ncbi:MAG: hypothetical protein KDD09_23165, partial [Phaeodactylibacter sp.]|nr:hypothetical protein [Phaeodactylibacter sp.]